MEFGYVGINYKNANQDVRDKVSFTDNQKIDFMQKASELGVEQCMVLSTCNRSEVFFWAEQTEVVRKLYSESFPETEIADYLDCRSGDEALSYLYRVTAGLESMVLGEDQILGQVVTYYVVR